MIGDSFDEIDDKKLPTDEFLIQQYSNEANDALRSFCRLFGFCTSTLGLPGLTNEKANSSSELDEASLAVPSQLFTESQLAEISNLGNILVTLTKRKIEIQNYPTKILSEHIVQSSKEIIMNQNKQHKTVLDELYHKFDRLEEKLQDAFTNQSKRMREDPWADQQTNKKLYAPQTSPKLLAIPDDSKLVVSSSSGKTAPRSSGKKNVQLKPIRSSQEPEVRDPLLWIQDPKVRRKAQQLAEANVAYDPTASPLTLLNKHVYRIFENNNICYGLLALYEAPYFLVVYNDGDSQRLSLREVQLSLLNEQLAPPEELIACKYHVDHRTYTKRIPLPPM